MSTIYLVYNYTLNPNPEPQILRSRKLMLYGENTFQLNGNFSLPEPKPPTSNDMLGNLSSNGCGECLQTENRIGEEIPRCGPDARAKAKKPPKP